MRGIKFLSMTALAANNRASQTQSSTTINSAEKQVSVAEPLFGRRAAFQSIMLGAAMLAPAVSNGLDMDAFMNSQLDSDTKNCDPKKDPKCMPKLSADEAMCQYGQSGTARGEACKRVKASGGKLPSPTKEKSLGGAYAK
eukprot:scaffold4447_cov120-Cylindrotheca_fusiformis.AAC.9